MLIDFVLLILHARGISYESQMIILAHHISLRLGDYFYSAVHFSFHNPFCLVLQVASKYEIGVVGPFELY